MVVEVSREDVLALMPHKRLTRVSGEPTHLAVKKAEHELSTNLLAVESPFAWGQGKGYLGIIQSPAVFVARNGAAFAPPAAAPPIYPDIPAGATTAAREQLRAEHKDLLRH